MRKNLHYLKNKYIITLIVFVIYSLFLDENDIFSIYNKQRKLSAIQKEKAILSTKHQETKKTLLELNDIEALEKYAREKKLFKKDDEDIYVISTEKKAD